MPMLIRLLPQTSTEEFEKSGEKDKIPDNNLRKQILYPIFEHENLNRFPGI